MSYVSALKFTSKILRPKFYAFSHLIANRPGISDVLNRQLKTRIHLPQHCLLLQQREGERENAPPSPTTPYKFWSESSQLTQLT